MSSDFFFQYEYVPSPDAEEALAQAWDIIFALIVKEIQAEKKEEREKKENETC